MPATLESFRRKEFLQGEAVVTRHRGTRSELGGFLDEVPEDTTIIPTVSAVAMPSGVVTRSTYDAIVTSLMEMLDAQPIDGIFLALHGSMCVEGIEDPEGDLLYRLRVLYPEAVIGCTLDHHANVSKLMAENSDFLVGYRTHPHIDQYQVGQEAGRLIMRKDIRNLQKAFIRLPFVTRAENRSEPVNKLRDYVEALCSEPDVINASFFVGYPWADVSIMGCSVYVLQKYGTKKAYAENFASFFWSLRDDFHFSIEKMEAVPELLRTKGAGPLVLDELSDCTFGGSSGDAVTSARFLADKHIDKSIVVGIVDSETVEAAFRTGEGGYGHFTIGGKICTISNPPLKGNAKVVSLHRDVRPLSPMLMESGMLFKRVAVLDYKGVLLAVIEYPGQIGGPAFLRAIGMQAADFDCIVVKEGLNPFVTYKDVAYRIVMIESAGFNPQRLKPDMYKNLTETIYPIFPPEADLYKPRRCI